MPFFEDTTCPFCGARFSPGASACPACDLPLLGEDGSLPPERESTPFDGASLFDDAFPEEDFMPQRHFEPPLATELRNQEGGDEMRCLVVAMNVAEAEMLEDMLRAEGVPCMVRSTTPASFRTSDYRCEVLVPQFALSTARQLLRIEAPAPPEPEPMSYATLTFAILVGLLALAGCVALAMTFA
jgi:hypothetical protein